MKITKIIALTFLLLIVSNSCSVPRLATISKTTKKGLIKKPTEKPTVADIRYVVTNTRDTIYHETNNDKLIKSYFDANNEKSSIRFESLLNVYNKMSSRMDSLANRNYN